MPISLDNNTPQAVRPMHIECRLAALEGLARGVSNKGAPYRHDFCLPCSLAWHRDAHHGIRHPDRCCARADPDTTGWRLKGGHFKSSMPHGDRRSVRVGWSFTVPSLTPPFWRMSFARAFRQKKSTQPTGRHQQHLKAVSTQSP
jgi:hypothetical protein